MESLWQNSVDPGAKNKKKKKKEKRKQDMNREIWF